MSFAFLLLKFRRSNFLREQVTIHINSFTLKDVSLRGCKFYGDLCLELLIIRHCKTTTLWDKKVDIVSENLIASKSRLLHEIYSL